MRKTGMHFTWRTTKNGDAIEELKKHNIAFEYNHFGELTADFYGIGVFEKVDFERVEGDVYEICIAQPKRSTLERQPRDGLPALMMADQKGKI